MQRALQDDRAGVDRIAAGIRWIFSRGNLARECPFVAMSPANLLSGDKLERVLLASKPPARSYRLPVVEQLEGRPIAELTQADRDEMQAATDALRAKLGKRPTMKVRRPGLGSQAKTAAS